MDRAARGLGGALVRAHHLSIMPQTRWPEHSSRPFAFTCRLRHIPQWIRLRLHVAALRISDMMNCLVVQRNGGRGVVLSHPGEYGDKYSAHIALRAL